MTENDEALVLACRRGDAAAWEALVRRYQRLIYTIPRRAGLSEDLVAEVFQASFTLLVEHLDRLERPERVGAWLVTTARRETWRLAREARLLIPLAGPSDDEDAVGELPDKQALPDELVIQLEQQHLVRTAVSALDERCRDLLTILFYQPEPPPYSEIAAAMGTTAGSIGPTRARCLEKLRRLLAMSGI